MKRHFLAGPNIAGLVAAIALTAGSSYQGSFAQTQPAPASQHSTVAQSTDSDAIDGLENKFFEHRYASDPTGKRLERIEKLVFGEARSGSDSVRVANILSVVPLSHNTSTNGASKTATTPATTAVRAVPSPIPAANTAAVSNSSNYPSVTALENQILGETHLSDSVRPRLDRLETKAFGKPTVTSDLSLRVSELQKYARENGLAQPDAGSPIAKYSPPPAASGTNDAKLTWLEQQVYGRAVPDSSIYDRVRRLNLSVLPKSHLEFDGSLPENISTLISAVELEQADRLNGVTSSTNFRPLPSNLPGGFATTAPKMNKTATMLNNMGLPSPMSQIGASPDSIASTAGDEDDSETDSKGKKKKKHGFWSSLKETLDESYSDTIMGVPRYAYGDNF